MFLLSLQLLGATKPFPVMGHWGLLHVMQGINRMQLSHLSTEGINSFMVDQDVGVSRFADSSETVEL